MIVWAYGGGTQTAAIAVLIHRGELLVPDITVMADTSREATETWEYLEQVMRPYLREVGVEVEIAPHSLATVDLYGGADGDTLLMPAYDSGDGRLSGFCSNEWKARVMQRHLRKRGVKSCTQWLGYSVDEMRRVHDTGQGWIRNAFPLIEKRITRAGCKLLVEQEGLPPPPKSSCWMCPHRRDWQWRRLRDHYPDDFAKAVALDHEIRANDKQGGVFLSDQRLPLDKINLDNAVEPVDEPNLFRNCESGYCWV